MKKIILIIIGVVVLIAACLYFLSLLKPDIIPRSVKPSKVVEIYMKSTLGTLPDSKIDYDLAKEYLAPELKERFDEPGFIPLSYCIQDGPNDVRIDSEEISDSSAKVRVSAEYGEWQDMWEFGLVVREGEWKIKEINCTPFIVVYINTEYGFSLECPADWYKVDNPEFGSVFFSSKEEEPPMGGVSLGARIEIFVIENSESLGLEEWIERNKTQGGPVEEVLKRERITVGGQKAIKEVNTSIIVGALPEGVEIGNPTTVYMAKDNYIVQINYTGRDIGLEAGYWGHLHEFQCLLDSFKFQ